MGEYTERLHLQHLKSAVEEVQAAYGPAALDELIARHIDPNPDHRGVSEAVTRDRNVSVWALVMYVEATDGDLEQAADGYCLPVDAVRAALAFYARYPQAILAQVLIKNPELVEVTG